ncbi:MAG TPA: 4-hydroxy-tetrahydrodipicolinate synthase [Caulobacteraceae bacterium]|nr:4-hydroxy-tetrahydrodipicolinate synthase [Caulobacteraceae bacterium]
MKARDLSWLKGSFPPLVTPFLGGRIDLETYGRLIDRQIEGGSDGIVVNGTTAEPSTLTLEERNELVDFAVRRVRGRLPVVAATGSQSLAEALTLSTFAERAGADAQLIVTPYYIRPPQRGLVAYYVEALSKLSTPAMVYHIPGRAAVSMDVASFVEVRNRCDNLVGVKHAATDLGFVTDLLAAMGREFRVFVGLEELCLPMMAVGAVGMMNAVGNLDPARVAAMGRSIGTGDLARARDLHFQLYEISKAIFFDTNPIPLKYMMKRIGLIAENEHRLPMAPAPPALADRLDSVLRAAGLLEAQTRSSERRAEAAPVTA